MDDQCCRTRPGYRARGPHDRARPRGPRGARVAVNTAAVCSAAVDLGVMIFPTDLSSLFATSASRTVLGLPSAPADTVLPLLDRLAALL